MGGVSGPHPVHLVQVGLGPALPTRPQAGGRSFPPGLEPPLKSGGSPDACQRRGDATLSCPFLPPGTGRGDGSGQLMCPLGTVDGMQHRSSRGAPAEAPESSGAPSPHSCPPALPGVPERWPHPVCSVPRARRQARHQLREEPLCLIRLVLRLHVCHRLHRECPWRGGHVLLTSRQPAGTPEASLGTHVRGSLCKVGAVLLPSHGVAARIRRGRQGCPGPARVCTDVPQRSQAQASIGTSICLSGRVREEDGGVACLPRGPQAPPTGYLGEAPGKHQCLGGQAGPLRTPRPGEGQESTGLARGCGLGKMDRPLCLHCPVAAVPGPTRGDPLITGRRTQATHLATRPRGQMVQP